MREHDAHEHAHHENVGPPEPDKVNSSMVFLWGMASFVFVIVTILALGGYFWSEIGAEDEAKVRSVYQTSIPDFPKKIETLHAEEKARLGGGFELEGGRKTMPIDEAMKRIAERNGRL